MLFFFIYLIS
jgi:large subunit ribosomal protein L7/L12